MRRYIFNLAHGEVNNNKRHPLIGYLNTFHATVYSHRTSDSDSRVFDMHKKVLLGIMGGQNQAKVTKGHQVKISVYF